MHGTLCWWVWLICPLERARPMVFSFVEDSLTIWEDGYVRLFDCCIGLAPVFGEGMDVTSFNRGWIRLPPPSFQVARFAGRKLALAGCMPIDSTAGWGLRSGVVARRGKSLRASRFGIGSFAFVPAVIVLQLGMPRDFSISAELGAGVTGADELIGKESICCWVGFGWILLATGVSLDDQPWFAGMVGS